ncbi:MAG: oxidoreductase [Ketobacteraceae bacterium]|nr:oxidoreductase [Ketobacteraceae bacterium]
MSKETGPQLEVVSSINEPPLTVLLAGATGLIGSHCLDLLLASPRVKKVIAPTRRTLSNTSSKLRNVLVDFDRLDEYQELFQCDAIICCLGTTIRQAGSKKAFKRVDLEYCLDIAELGRSQTAKAYYLVSAMGADPNSLFFYSRVKGELERRLVQLEYDYLSLYRPSLLMGDREEHRFAESLGIRLASVINPFLMGSFAKYKAIDASKVARAIVNECTRIGIPEGPGPAVNIYTHNQIVTLANHPDKLLKGK